MAAGFCLSGPLLFAVFVSFLIARKRNSKETALAIEKLLPKRCQVLGLLTPGIVGRSLLCVLRSLLLVRLCLPSHFQFSSHSKQRGNLSARFCDFRAYLVPCISAEAFRCYNVFQVFAERLLPISVTAAMTNKSRSIA